MKTGLSLAMRNSPKKKLSNIISLIWGVVAELESQRSWIYGVPGHQSVAKYQWKILTD